MHIAPWVILRGGTRAGTNVGTVQCSGATMDGTGGGSGDLSYLIFLKRLIFENTQLIFILDLYLHYQRDQLSE